jgi:pimeloyl-ACP methyl ester carboxylesterase
MPRTKRYSRITYTAPILGGYQATADFAPSDGEWRVLAVPGTPSRPHMFTRFLEQAPEDLEIVVPNRPGYGGAYWGKGVRKPVLSFNDQVAAFRPFLDKLDGKRTIVLGVSYGGALALKTALENPARIAGAVTVAMLVTEPRKYVHGAMKLSEMWGVRHVLPGYLHNARAEVAGRREQIGPLFARLPELRAPVTIMHGDLDTLVPLSDAMTLQRYFGEHADVEFELVKGGTHYLELQFPQRLYKAIRGVIARAERVGA